MADYYPLLARALDAMPDRSPALRQAVYERARGALIGQLRSLDPPLSEDDIDLDHVRRPDATYGLAKVTGEQLAAHAEADGTRVHILRPFSGYGGDQDEAYPFPAFIARARHGDDPFEVWGDGTSIRDWIHIDDLVGATLAAIAHDVTGPVNLGLGRPTTFDELARLVTERAGYTPAIKHLPDAPQGVHTRVSDPARMLRFYRPLVDLEEGIARVLTA